MASSLEILFKMEDRIYPYFLGALLPYALNIILYWFGVIRSGKQEETVYRVTVFEFDDWKGFLKPVTHIVLFNFVISFLAALAHQDYRASSLLTILLNLLHGGWGGMLWAAFFIMSFSSAFSLLTILAEVTAKVVNGAEKANFSIRQQLLIGHSFGLIAGGMLCPLGTILWMAQDNLLAGFTIQDLQANQLGGLARLYVSAILHGMNIGIISGYIKHIAIVRLRASNADMRIAIYFGIIIFAIMLLLYAVYLTQQPNPNVFWLNVFYEDSGILVRWSVYLLTALFFAYIGIKLLDRVLQSAFAARYGLEHQSVGVTAGGQ